MMDLQFLGDWAPWQGAGLGALLALVCWRLYRRELRGRRGAACVGLPALRSTVLFLLALMLTGPVLHVLERIGQLAQVTLIVDATASMGLRDPAMPAGRKLLLAHRLGLISGELPRPEALAAADRLATARAAVAAALDKPASEPLRRGAIALAEAVEGAQAELRSSDVVQSLPRLQPGVTWEYWANIPGSTLDELRKSPRYPGEPSGREVLDRLEVRANWADHYGARMSGLLIPPETGDYEFNLMSDDQGELWLSADQSPEGLRQVARVISYVGPGEWERNAEQKSAPISLVAGQRYYFEALHKEGAGGDFQAVGWRLPSGRVERPIAGASLGLEMAGVAPDWTQRVAQLRALLPEEGADGAAVSRLQEALTETATLEGAMLQAFDAAVEEQVKADPATAAALERLAGMSRWQRAQALLLEGEPSLLARLAQKHDVQVLTLDENALTPVWSARAGRRGRAGAAPLMLDGAAAGLETDLALALTAEAPAGAPEARGGASGAGGKAPGPRSAIVLLSDGRHNAAESPLHPAKALGSRGGKLFAVGLGATNSPPDVALADVEAPATVFHQDRVAGRVCVMDNAPAGQAFRLVATSGDTRLWEQSLTTHGGGRRWIPFDFSVEAHVAALAATETAGVQYASRPLALTFSLEGLTSDAEPRNNRRETTLLAMIHKRKVLMIEGRPRWEWRFVYSLFSRDARWEVTRALADGRVLPRGDGADRMPATREALFMYDLVVLGDVASSQLYTNELTWIREFVGDRGGGLVLLDGRRQQLRGYAGTPLSDLLPVRWTAESFGDEAPLRLQVSATGQALPAFQLVAGAAENPARWQVMPPPHGVAPVEALPGSEVQVEGVWAARTNAVVVSRRFGAGTLLYLASDEFWRWRSVDAGETHRRFWMQAAEWIMEAPFPVQDAHVALDTGAATYAPGEQAALRVRLRDARGRPLPEAQARAVLTRDGVAFAEMPLSVDAAAAGIYRATTPALPAGNYALAVRVDGLPLSATPATLRFTVAPRDAGELTELAGNAVLLRELAAHAQGAYLPEERIDALEALLQPLSMGKTVERNLVVWQSYPWFMVIIALLTIEWIWRRKVGLL